MSKKSKKFPKSPHHNSLDSFSVKGFFNLKVSKNKCKKLSINQNLNFLIFLIFLHKKIILVCICILIFYNLNNKIKKLKKLKNHENKEKKINLICFDFLKKEKNFSKWLWCSCVFMDTSENFLDFLDTDVFLNIQI